MTISSLSSDILSDKEWRDFDEAIAENSAPLPLFRAQLKSARESLKKSFARGTPVEQLVGEHAGIVDQLLQRAWRQFIPHNNSDIALIALIAVGGYGRGELHPASDIDLLILTAGEQETKKYAPQIEPFLLFLWDIGLEVGHSTRNLNDCEQQAGNDITVATNLMEARLLTGCEKLFQSMREAIGPQNIWSSQDFFRAKREEQIARHHRFHDSAYNLEPNIKENPGGLRDLQVIGWVTKRHFGAENLHDLVTHDFLTEQEYLELTTAQNFLWRIRYGLHILAGRREDRLLFDHQRTLAEQFGYQDQDHHLAVECFMKDYYRTVMELSRLNEMLLELFEEEILYSAKQEAPTPLNEYLQVRHGVLEVTNKNVFLDHPPVLLELFLVMARDPELHSVSAGTIRLIRDHRHLINDEFRRNPECHQLFIELFRQGDGLTHELRRMNRYGVLGAYLPVFANIVGQMQHDLFHVYTVDEHTMFVVRNLRRFTVPEYAHEFPLCSQIIQRLDKQEVLTLAGFFHDIGKGRGGNHSTLGAVDAVKFCHEHGVSEHDTKIVKWLVENHLIMSTTAQRKDISDPEVVTQFAALVGNQLKLDYLYLLTVADIRATSPSLWNSWKNALLADLYRATTRTLRRGLDKPVDLNQLTEESQHKALELLQDLGFEENAVASHWQRLNTDYFLRYSIDEIAWHTRAILSHKDKHKHKPLILLRGETHRGGTEIFVYTQDRDYLFAIITSALEQLALNIIDARIITSCDDFTLDTFLVLEQDGEAITDQGRLDEIHKLLVKRLKNPDLEVQPNIQPSRQLKHFPIKTQVSFEEDAENNRTMMEVIAWDRPGLLARISRTLLESEILLQNAKIATFGERAEDIFYITNSQHLPLSEKLQDCLRNSIIQQLKL